MSKVLCIKASPRTGRSHSIAVADAFVESYLQANQNNNIMTIDNFKKPIPLFDSQAASAKYKIMHDEEHSPQDQQIWGEIVSVIDEFKSAFKYIIAIPIIVNLQLWLGHFPFNHGVT